MYFDKNVNPQPTLHVQEYPQSQWRGGLAEQQALRKAIPQHRPSGFKAHSDDWNNQYFDRTVSDHITAHTGSYVFPYQLQGSMAKGATNGE